MYVGPWQEYKLMRVIKEVKSENDRLKSCGMRGVPNSSVASTPRSNSSSSASSVHGSLRSGVQPRHQQQIDRLRPRPLDRNALIATPTSSERSAKSAPTIPSTGYGAEDPLHHRYSGHPAYQELTRGAPMASSEREALAGQPGLRRKVTGPLKGDELEERLLRRSTLSMLYSGAAGGEGHHLESNGRAEPPTRAAQPAISTQRRPHSGISKVPRAGNAQTQRRLAEARGRPSDSSAYEGNVVPTHQQQGTAEPPMIRRNVVRDLAAFYDAHIHQANSSGRGGQGFAVDMSVPWETTPAVDIPAPSAKVDSVHERHMVVPPPPALPADFQFGYREQPTAANQQRRPLPNSSATVSTGSSSGSPKVDNDRERVAHKISQLLGGQDALDLHMKRRPYDVGPPPMGSAPYKGVAASKDYGAGSSVGSQFHPSSSSSTSSSLRHGLNDTVDAFTMSNDEDRLHQHAEAVLRASQERRPFSKSGVPLINITQKQTTSAGYQHGVPPPPVLPPDFMSSASDPPRVGSSGPSGNPGRYGPNAGSSNHAVDWIASPNKRVTGSSLTAVSHQRPSSVATDLSIEGEDVGALLNWAATLDNHGGRGWAS